MVTIRVFEMTVARKIVGCSKKITGVTQTSWTNCLSKKTLWKSSELDVRHTSVTLAEWTPTDLHMLLLGHISTVACDREVGHGKDGRTT